MKAPIILFTYNRPEHAQQTFNALAQNVGAKESVLYVYCDGVKEGASEEQHTKVAAMQQLAQSWEGNDAFAEVNVVLSDKNKGLANSIIGGVTEVVNQYGKVIILEDDIITSVGFLNYMNDALELYQKDEKVMHISGYMYPHRCTLPNTFFYQVPYPGGGWATWARAWQYYNDNTQELYDAFKNNWKQFNSFGGNYLQVQLEKNLDGSLHTWFIKWHAVLLQRNALTLYPSVSLTNNIGFDDTGSNCFTTSKFDVDNLAQDIDVKRVPIVQNKKAARIIYEFYQGRWYNKRNRKRIYNKIKSWFHL